MKILTEGVKLCVAIAAGCAILATGFAKSEQWSDAKGKKFEGEPAELLGPLALFRTAGHGSMLLPLNMLSQQDCIRFAEELRSVPQPAADWAKSTTRIGREIYDHVLRPKGAKLVDAELKGTREPRFYVLYFANTSEPNSWEMLRQSVTSLPELQKRHPGLVEGLMFGLKHSTLEQINMALEAKVPYLVARLNDEGKMSEIGSMVPTGDYGIVVTNCNGVPLFLSKGDSAEATKRIMADFGGLLDLLDPTNAEGWAAEMYYWKAVQPALHAADACDPKMVGDPLSAAKLAKLGVKHFDITVFVSAEGVPTATSLSPGADLPEPLVQPITEALQRSAQFVPAVDHGKFVAGKYRYHFGAE